MTARGQRKAETPPRAQRGGGERKADGAPQKPSRTSPCPCGDDDMRRAVAVDPDIKERNLKRLRRIEGQVRGLQKMVEEERYCADVMTQISSVHEALRAVGKELMRNHLKHCAAQAIRASDEAAETMYDELVELMFRHAR